MSSPHSAAATELARVFYPELIVLARQPDGILLIDWIWSVAGTDCALQLTPEVVQGAQEIATDPRLEQQFVFGLIHQSPMERPLITGDLRSRIDIHAGELWSHILDRLIAHPVFLVAYGAIASATGTLTLTATKMAFVNPRSTRCTGLPIEAHLEVIPPQSTHRRTLRPLLRSPPTPREGVTDVMEADTRTGSRIPFDDVSLRLFENLEQVIVEALYASLRREAERSSIEAEGVQDE